MAAWFSTSVVSLNEDEVHVWKAGIQMADALRPLLDPEELRAAERFVRADDRRRFVVGRGLLRWFLGAYLRREPASVPIQVNPYGKPETQPSGAAEKIEFNVSHSGEIVLLAFARGRRVGVDVELVRPELVSDSIMATAFSAAERQAVQASPAGARARAFFACWTRKEAYIKALGYGLSLPLGSFDVSVDPDGEAQLLAVRPPHRQSWRLCSLRSLEVGAGYQAALAAEGRGWRHCLRGLPAASVGSPG